MLVSFPALPLPFFGRPVLHKLTSVLGRLLKIDAATEDLRRPSVARVLVEMDVTQTPVSRIWIGEEEYGFWQKVEYENWPEFCSFCERFGHEEQQCFKKHPTLKPTKISQPQQTLSRPTWVRRQGDAVRDIRKSGMEGGDGGAEAGITVSGQPEVRKDAGTTVDEGWTAAGEGSARRQIDMGDLDGNALAVVNGVGQEQEGRSESSTDDVGGEAVESGGVLAVGGAQGGGGEGDTAGDGSASVPAVCARR